MPRSMGDSMLHLGEIDQLVLVDMPVNEYQHPRAEEQVAGQIARSSAASSTTAARCRSAWAVLPTSASSTWSTGRPWQSQQLPRM